MKKYYILAAATLALAACSNDDNYVDGPVAARISATIGEGNLSRATDSIWAPGDQIGITMADRHINVMYTTAEGDGSFAGTTMYFKNKTEPVTLTAYYPFSGKEGEAPASVGISTTAELQTAGEQPKIDFLYAKEENVVGSEPNVTFSFSHKMGKLTLIFKNGNGADVSNILSYKIKGLVLDGTFDPVTGDCAAKSGADADSIDIDLRDVTVTSGESVPPLIIFPQDLTGKTVTLSISDSDGQDYACNLTFDENSIVSGNNYTYTIKVNKTGLTVNKSTISDWNTKAEDFNADAV